MSISGHEVLLRCFHDPFQIFDRDSGRDGTGRQNRISGDTEGEEPETKLRKKASFLPIKPFFFPSFWRTALSSAIVMSVFVVIPERVPCRPWRSFRSQPVEAGRPPEALPVKWGCSLFVTDCLSRKFSILVKLLCQPLPAGGVRYHLRTEQSPFPQGAGRTGKGGLRDSGRH